MIGGTTKKCIDCGFVKPICDFYVQRYKHKKDSVKSECKACGKLRKRVYYLNHREQQIAYHREYRRKFPELARASYRRQREKNPDLCYRSYLVRNYGITLKDYKAMVASQGGVCAICGRRPSGNGVNKRLFIDHNHSTKKIRALLCSNCNFAIGHMRDDASLAQKMADYLRSYAGGQIPQSQVG